MENAKLRKRAKALVSLLSLAILISGAVMPMFSFVKAENAQAGAVVINEIAWAGTASQAADEWIELYNATDRDIDLSGWLIDDDNGDQQYAIPAGIIAAYSYFLLEDAQEATNVNADLIVNLSFANAGDKLVLKDAAGNAIDTVNAAGGAWYAGSVAEKTTMERIDAANLNDDAANWAGNFAGSGAIDRNGSEIKGTPRGLNSASNAPAQPEKAMIELISSTTTPRRGDELQVQVKSAGAKNLFSYGFDIVYDSAVLEYVNADKGAFLSEQGVVQTSFYAGLENNEPGKLVAAEARIGENRLGVSGDGMLFTIAFRVIGADGANSNISVGNGSFLADPSNDLIAEFSGAVISVQITVTPPVQNLAAAEGAQRYEIALNWQVPEGGADAYRIFRKKPNNEFAEIGVANALNFSDSDAAPNGGRLIPNVIYEYRVTAVKNGIESAAAAVSQKETRGIKGDNNRSDRVDGRDLERLALHFAETNASAGFDALIDTTYDDRIDGSDLIDIGANWAVIYRPL